MRALLDADKITTYLGLLNGVLFVVIGAGALPYPYTLILVGIYGASTALQGYLTNKRLPEPGSRGR
jgi:hypothetical protein